MNLRHALTGNLGVKLIAVIVAVFIWFNASGQQEVLRVRTIPLVVQNVPDSLTITSPVPTNVEVSVRGTKRQLLLLGFRRVELDVDLTGAQPGHERVSLTPSDVNAPGSFDSRQISVLSPTVIDVRLERLLSRKVPVGLTTTGAIPEDYVIVGDNISVRPSSTSVRGPAARVRKLEKIPTAPLDLGRLKSAVERELSLDYNRSVLTCSPDHVTISVDVSPRGQRVLANVPPTVLLDSEDLSARVSPSTVSLTLEGASAVLDTLSSGDVSVLLNLGGRGPDRYRVAPEVILPPGVTLAGISADTLTVQITRAPSPQSP